MNKKVGGIDTSTPLQSIDYSYNIRGWMTKINDPANLNGKLFGYKVKYNEVEGLEIPNTDFSTLKVKPKYNGNIAEVDWRTGTVTGDNLRRYGYVYDNLNRLSAGFYQKDTNPSAKEYFEKMDYDLNGNITNLKRSGALEGPVATNIDDLAYVYTGNRLTSVTDSSTDYRGYPDTSGNEIPYDVNGNMASHVDKGILLIDYNFLNLPNYLKFNSGLSTRTGIINENTNYLYRADGTKLRKTFNYAPYNPLGTITQLSTKVTEYLDGFQYEGGKSGKQGIVSNLILKFVPTAEGYYNFENNKYIYNYTDHLGNVRLSYFKNGTNAEVLEENNYYPFGMKHEDYNALAGNPAYKYSYNGKELQTESGMYDYGARMYMSDIGRWGVVDPLAEKSRRFSPYNYAVNNPMRFIDPDGRSEQDWVKGGRDDTWHYRSDITSENQAKAAGYTSYSNGKGDDNSSYTTPLSRNGVNTGTDQKVVLGEGGNYKVDGASFTAKDEAPYFDSKEVDKVCKLLSMQIYAPAFIMSGGTGSAIGDYFIAAGQRGLTDLSTQAYFKGGINNVDGRQLLINTFVGGNGSESLQVAGKIGLANLSLNMTNNFGTSLYNGTFKQDATINTTKIFTGTLGTAAGIVGGNTFTNTLLPSIYMNGTDKLLNDANDKYNKDR